MNFKILMKKEVHKEIFTLMKNIDELNNGKEIGGWLLGKWKKDDSDAKLIIDKFIIPKQDVSRVDVDINSESMMDTFKEIGMKANNIVAQWHIHPFGTGPTSWSGTDEQMINDFMSSEKKREIFVFLLSSKDKIKARIEIVKDIEFKFIKKAFKYTKSIDNLEVDILEEQFNDEEIKEKLKKRIKDKVKDLKFNVALKDYENNIKYKSYVSTERSPDKYLNDSSNVIQTFLIRQKGTKTIVIIYDEFYCYLLENGFYESLPEPTQLYENTNNIVLIYDDITDENNVRIILREAEKRMEEESKKVEQKNSDSYFYNNYNGMGYDF